MAKKKTTSKKPPVPVVAATPAAKKPRRLQAQQYKSFRLSKKLKHPSKKLPSSWRIFKQSIRLLWGNKRAFGGVILIYAILYILFVRGLNGGLDIGGLKENMKEFLEGNFNNVASGIALFSYLLGSSGTSLGDLASAYQSMIIVIASLALIWSLRQKSEKAPMKAKEAYYNGMQPLIPFLLVIMVIGLQMIPAYLGLQAFSIVNENGLAVTLAEKVIWGMVMGLTFLLTIYMLASSVFALYIVTLPQMTPMRALRSARDLVMHRRFAIIRKVVLLPVVVVITAALIIVPVLIWATRFAEITFFLFTMCSLAILHSYLYNLYRELLK